MKQPQTMLLVCGCLCGGDSVVGYVGASSVISRAICRR